MASTRFPGHGPLTMRALPWHIWGRHRAPGSPLADLFINGKWKQGSGAREGRVMVSMTQFTTTHLADLPGIWSASERLGEELARIEGAVGVLTYFRPARRQVGSLSIWSEDRGLSTFVGLPYHVDIMKKYRTRGLPIRSAKWWADDVRIATAMMEGLHMLDNSPLRRVVHTPQNSNG